jgi:c(7)-type cytochrome triheme protein
VRRGVVAAIIVTALVSVGLAKVGGGDITFKPKGVAPVVFSHEKHVTGQGLKCTDCHASLYVTKEKHKKATMAEMKKGRSCGACHDGTKAFEIKGHCDSCHTR